MSSFYNFGGNLGDDSLRSSLVSGTFDTQPPKEEGSDELWAVSKAWDTALRKLDVIKPSTSADVGAFLKLHDFGDLLCPFRLYHPTLIKRLGSDENAKEAVMDAERALSEFLEGEGF